MKTRIVMWGTNEKEEKVLIAIALRAADNAVDIYEFPVNSTTEEFYNLMLNEWRESHDVPFPEDFKHTVRPLTASDHILPETLKVERPDVVVRAQTEWHFIVLSHKLYQTYKTELDDLKAKISKAGNYSGQLWDEMKSTWEKIQKHMFDSTLLREHTAQLRDMTNDMFTQLKNMRKDFDSESDKLSKEVSDAFNDRLDKIDEKVKSGLGLQPLFDELKRIQTEFKTANLNRNDRNKLWKRIDQTFKSVKEKKFGDRGTKDSSAIDRLQRRYDGLIAAIDKMEKSIKRDDKDRHFEDDRITQTEGQLEAQIRMAKLKMINERISSKNEKLDEMLKTKLEIEQKIEKEKKHQEEVRRQQSLKDEIRDAKEAAKQKIADNMHTNTSDQDADTLKKAAAAIAEEKESRKKGKESLFDAIKDTVGSSLDDLGTTLGAVASVVADKVSDIAKEVKEETSEAIDAVVEGGKKVSEKAKDMTDGKFTDKVKSEFNEAVAEGKEEFKEAKEMLSDFTDDAKSELKETWNDLKEDGKSAFNKAKDFADNLSDKLSDAVAEAKEEGKSIFDKISDFAGDVKDSVKEKWDELTEEEKLAEEERKNETKQGDTPDSV